MESRKVHHVIPGSDDRWRVKGEGAQRASGLHDNKGDAVARARALATSRPLAQVVVPKQDGTIQAESTYGGDPPPPKG